MASSNSNSSDTWPHWVVACLLCFPKKRHDAPTYREFSTVPYNDTRSAQGPYMMNTMPSRELRSFDRPRRFQYLSNPSQNTLGRPTTASSATTAHQRFPVNSGNVYGAEASDPRERWSKSLLTPSQFAELLDNIHATLSHVPYAICGLAALNDYGYTTRRLNSVSLLCPAYAKDNVRGWLKTKGYETYGDFFGIPIGDRGYGGEGATVYRVRIKWISDDGFAWLEKVKSNVSDAWVLGLEAQIDYCAMGFVEQFRKVEEMKKVPGKEKSTEVTVGESRLRMAAKDIFWCLDKAARTRHKINEKYLPTLLGEEFWGPFTKRYSDARPEMARAGIDVAAVLARHRDRQEVRDHQAMLRQFGLGEEVVVNRQPTPFEGMRTLANSKSMYSLRQGRDATIPESPMPAVLKPESPYLDQGDKPLPKVPEKKEGRLAGLLRRSSSTKEKEREKERAKFPKISKPLGYSRNLTLGRSRSVRSPPRDPALVPLPRESAEIERSNSEWI
ncbi:hypothetical protein F4805DRAFT_438691 [Annulohypoxylon moriforme]|nr:hypothetical protein F4805DRAFT_438691 [Annulohypoxylon moriforme]